jgi:hypothetical protein
MDCSVKRIWTACLAVMGFAWISGAAERPSPLPDATPVPMVQGEAAVKTGQDQARQAGKGLVADLTLGQEGGLVSAPSSVPLKPGRYRLHALVASTPQNHILAEAVALRLKAGASGGVFDPRRFPKAGELAPVILDFTVREPGVVTIAADWLVGDSKLDRETYRNPDEARRVYLGQRQNALNQLSLKANQAAGPAETEDAALGGLLGDMMEEKKPRLQPRALSGADLPPYRLLLAGLTIERLSPVSINSLATDKPAYAPGDKGKVSLDLQNWAAEPVALNLEWTVTDDARSGETLATHTEVVNLPAGQTVTHAFAEPFDTAGILRLGRIRVKASLEGLRACESKIPFVMLPERPPATARPKKVFAHYMGCYPAATGATRYHLLNLGKDIRHEKTDDVTRRGGRFKNADLTPYGPALTAEQSADLEIKRAMRIGIDGFAIDAWAGDEGAKKTFDTLIKVAEKNRYPFELTVCLDPVCGGDPVRTVKELLEKYGNNPNLARRDGKPLIFGYMSWCFGVAALAAEIDSDLSEDQKKVRMNELRTSELGWHLMGQSFRKAEEQVGQPIFYQACITYFFHEVDKALIKPGMFSRAAGCIAKHVGAIGEFGGAGGGYGDKLEDVAKAVQTAGAEWSGVGGMHQKENIPFEIYMPAGTEWLRGVWNDTIRDNASLVQLITWNDYTENTAIAPAYNTRYTIYDLTGYYISWWKAGQPPKSDHDRVYLTYAKYPKDAKSWPFSIVDRRDRAIEVLTILTAPATVRLPGRDIEYEAPAGLFVKQFPVTIGPMVAELVRDGKVSLRLESPEPVTDRPFREDNALVCFSTEFERLWKEDFGAAKPLLYSEYGDVDQDGLPNWYEMYWFTRERDFKPVEKDDVETLVNGPVEHPVTRWADMSTAALVDPKADPDGDGKSNLDEFKERTDPTVPALPGTDAGAGKKMDNR